MNNDSNIDKSLPASPVGTPSQQRRVLPTDPRRTPQPQPLASPKPQLQKPSFEQYELQQPRSAGTPHIPTPSHLFSPAFANPIVPPSPRLANAGSPRVAFEPIKPAPTGTGGSGFSYPDFRPSGSYALPALNAQFGQQDGLDPQWIPKHGAARGDMGNSLSIGRSTFRPVVGSPGVGTLVRQKTLTRPERTVERPNILAPTPERKCSPWIAFVYSATCCFPGFCLKKVGKMHDKAVQFAWREKVALCWIVVAMCIILAYLTFGLQATLCQPDANTFTAQDVEKFNPQSSANRYVVHGVVYNMAPVLKTHAEFGTLKGSPTADLIATKTGIDISAMFPQPLSTQCSSMLRTKFSLNCTSPAFGSVAYCHTSAASSNMLAGLRMGPVIYEWEDIGDVGKGLIVYRGLVLNVKQYLEINSPIFGPEVDTIIRSHRGKDATSAFSRANLVPVAECFSALFTVGRVSSDTLGCWASNIVLYISLIIIASLLIIRFVLAIVFSWIISNKLGKLRKDEKLMSPDRRLSRRVEIDAGRIPFTMQLKGELAIGQRGKGGKGGKAGKGQDPSAPGALMSAAETRETLRRRNTNGRSTALPTSGYGKELHTVLLVTCYSEDEHGLRTTFNSLALTDFSEDNKVLFIIADGLIKGSGNSLTTPETIINMLEMDPNWGEPEALSYLAIGEGSKAHNKAKVYVGWYSHEDRVLPTILVVKCGTEEEAKTPKPGNRGKRDSQMILMRFFHRVTFDEPMTPLEYDLFQKLHYLMGVTPDVFEIVLMVDADTKVAPDSLARMVACMIADPSVMGLCGETRIANKTQSWVTRIQVFEYYLSHHLNKAFESIFGGVTCLPGCFCMYRIKAPKDGYWVPILCNPEIVKTYSESVVDTLHKKNLLLLGEDRFLTTLMLSLFPRRKLIFVPRAFCKTTVPDTFSVLLSQRRRWINSTIHNLLELVLVPNLCGTFCFSMQFVVFLELIGTVTLPAAIFFTFVLIISAIVGPVVPVIPLLLLAGILGLPAVLILFTTRRLVYIYWMFVYLLALPIWNFVLPVYAFWHFDDFSWGQTRMVEGEGGKGGHGDSDGTVIDADDIPTRHWVDWELERRHNIVQQWMANTQALEGR